MTALASDSAPDLTVLADDAFDWLRRTVTEACAREIAAERDLAIVSAALRRERQQRAVLGVGESWVLGL